jgi:hypothetical protein
MGVSSFTIWRTLHEQVLHPYHLQRVQHLKPEDPPRRIAFCQWLLQKIDEEPNFLSIVLTTDEAGFTREGVFSTHNTHIWSEENPHQIRERGFQQRFSINVWAGIIGNRLIGPHVLPPHLNGEGYLNFLQNQLSDLLDDVPLQVRRDMWYLHDGAPAHSARGVKNWLDANLENRWIGRNGPVLWPARSPDLNPCDFFLWGHLKQIVYETPVNTVEELTVRVNNAAQSIRRNSDMLVRTQASMARRAQAEGVISIRTFNSKVSALDQVCCVTSMSLSLTTNKELVFAWLSKFLSSFAFNVRVEIKLIKILSGFRKIFRKNSK